MNTKLYKVVNRRSDKFIVKPKAEQIDGKIYQFYEGWKIGEEDSSIYVGESAMIPLDSNYPEDAPKWIASGDLEEMGDSTDGESK